MTEPSRFALLIGNNAFTDERLSRLNAPTEDVIELQRVLRDDCIGDFDSVSTSINEPYNIVREQIHTLFENRKPDDLVLLYYSGHGLLTASNDLYLATVGSDLDRPKRDSLWSAELRQLMNDCRSRRQIVILDCCHSGSFARGMKPGDTPPPP